MRTTIVDRFMNEVILLGGLPVTRATAYSILRDEFGPRQAGKFDTPDYFAFKPEAVEGIEPWTKEQFLAVERGIRS